MQMLLRITNPVLVKNLCKRPHLQLHLLHLYLGMLWLLVHNRTMLTVSLYHHQPQPYHPEWWTMCLRHHQLPQAVYRDLVWLLEMVWTSPLRAITFKVGTILLSGKWFHCYFPWGNNLFFCYLTVLLDEKLQLNPLLSGHLLNNHPLLGSQLSRPQNGSSVVFVTSVRWSAPIKRLLFISLMIAA